MSSGNEVLISILLSSITLLVIVGMVIATIALLKKGKQYNNFAKILMTILLVILLGFSLFLLYTVFTY